MQTYTIIFLSKKFLVTPSNVFFQSSWIRTYMYIQQTGERRVAARALFTKLDITPVIKYIRLLCAKFS